MISSSDSYSDSSSEDGWILVGFLATTLGLGLGVILGLGLTTFDFFTTGWGSSLDYSGYYS